MTTPDHQPELAALAELFTRARAEVARVIVGQTAMVDRLLLALVANGHVLLEGVPGLAKTTAVKALAETIHTGFARIQFTPDLLPADLIGTEIYRPQTGEFTVKRGPIFTNLLLADEINRTPPKTQAALLESMQERQVTVGGVQHKLPDPFFVLATQNPIEQEGTYPLPEAQVDRFMLKLRIDYPSRTEEREIMRRMSSREAPRVTAVLHPEDIARARGLAESIHMDARVEDYIVSLVFATREPQHFKLERLANLVDYGASPRASIALARAARVQALFAGRTYVTPGDVKAVALDVLRHRIIPSYEAEARELDADALVREILGAVDVP